MSVPTAIMEEDLANWSRALTRLDGDTEALKAAFVERWRNNATSVPPSLLPTGGQIAADHGWSVSLELFLLSKDERDSATTLLTDAILGATRAVEKLDLSLGEVWIEDVLALRRVPPPRKMPPYDKRYFRVDMDVALGILNAVNGLANALPAPRRSAYGAFRRVYMMLTNALVSEIVEAESQGLVLVDYGAGRRLTPPDARSVFRDLPQMHMAIETWPKAQRDRYNAIRVRWIGLIHKLVDTILKLNSGLEHVVATGEADDKILGAFARQFDWALYRLIVADLMHRSPKERERLQDVLLALDKIHQKSGGKYSRPAYFYRQRSQVGEELWYGGAITRPRLQLRQEVTAAPEQGRAELLPLVEDGGGDFEINVSLILSFTDVEDHHWILAASFDAPIEEIG